MESQLVVRVIKGQAIITCPHKNCSGMVVIMIDELIQKRAVRESCRGGRVSHEVIIKLQGVDFVKISVEET
ncbi:MAG: hypothetical protein QXP78_05225 [Candidatus Bathyarchaeia archaeon]